MNNKAQARLLPVVILALGAFAVLKAANMWVGFSAAGANDTAPGMLFTAAPAAPDKDALFTTEKPHEAAAPETTPGEVERRILEQLADRRAGLDAREAALATREAVIAAAEKKLHQEISTIQSEREQLLALRTEQEASASEEIEALVSAYERMKSKDAAAIFNELDEDILVPVSAGMRTQALAGVLAEMQPAKARELTKLLADRNKIDRESPAADAP